MGASLALTACDSGSDVPDDSPTGVAFPEGVQDWTVLSVNEHTADPDIRILLGNTVAANAARLGNTNPWPEGSMLADLVWQVGGNPYDQENVRTTGAFKVLPLMVKDTARFPNNPGGWAYGAWLGEDLTPAPAGFDADCMACHEGASDNDYVFNVPAPLPGGSVVSSAPTTPNNVTVPVDFYNWRFINVTKRLDNNQLRVVLGNDVAVKAAREGNTLPYPNGSVLADVVWAAESDVIFDGVDTPAGFGALAVMDRNSTAYPNTTGWGYGIWQTSEMNGPEAGFDTACNDCHVANAMPAQYVFTLPAVLPGILGE